MARNASSPIISIPKKKTDLWVRLASSIVLGPFALFCVWYGGWLLALLLAALAVGCLDEWRRMCGVQGPSPAANENKPLRAGKLPWKTGSLAIAVALFSLVWLRAGAQGAGNIFFLLAVVWSTDSGAYAAGRCIGGPKLAPAISPGKTWSGALGGLLAAVLAGQAWLFWHGLPHAQLHAQQLKVGSVALGLSVISQSGDLLESWCKRRAGVKDSGFLIPGHGGLLDRLDGLLTASPAAALILWAGGQSKGLW